MFRPNRQVDDADVRYAIINNSATITRGCTLEPVAGSQPIVTLGTIQDIVLGVVLAIVGRNGKVLELDSYAAEADNLTDKMVKVAYLPGYVPMTFVSDLDAAAGTTSNSGGFANFQVDSTGLLVDESTVQVAMTTSTGIENMQVMSYGLTGKNTTQVECRFINTGVGYNIA